MSIIFSKITLPTTFMLFALSAQASIYGNDNRKDLFETSNDIQLLARSTVTLMRTDELTPLENSFKYRDQINTHGKEGELQVGEPFYSQPSHSYCSGTLIAPNVVLTATHCIQYIPATQTAFVFDYKMENSSDFKQEISKDNVYYGKSIVFDIYDQSDFMLVILDRNVVGREPIHFNPDAVNTPIGTSVFIIHYPSGLPAKFSDDAEISSTYYEKQGNYPAFKHDLDTFGGSSGAPIFDSNTHLMIGMLTMGEKDFKKNLFNKQYHEAHYTKLNYKKHEIGAFLNASILKKIPN